MYDYVIVGAGSAGCVLAARLSEDPGVNVLLLESGPPDTNENIHVPVGYLSLGRTEVDWDLETAPEPFCDSRRIKLPRGRVLGGSSSINAMVYIRGHRADYDGWGIPGWSYDDLLPYFIKAEDNERGANEFHGVGGPLPVSDSRSKNPMVAAFAQAGVEAGHPAHDDFNGAEQDGFGIYQVTQRHGMRASEAVAEFEQTQSGVLTSNLAEGGGFVRIESGAQAPDTQFHIAPVQIVDEGMSDPEAHGLWISACLLNQEARGSVRLQNNDPTGK